jgi:hypothetical protein
MKSYSIYVKLYSSGINKMVVSVDVTALNCIQRGKSMLTQAEMFVVIVLDETISQGS